MHGRQVNKQISNQGEEGIVRKERIQSDLAVIAPLDGMNEFCPDAVKEGYDWSKIRGNVGQYNHCPAEL